MTSLEVSISLKKLIEDKISPLIDSDYVYLDLPFHANIGDTLIWEGTEDFFKQIPHKCLSKSSIETFTFPKMRPQTIIIMHGGGNFGDVWIKHQEFRLKVIEQYPDNRIIILPQSIHYDSSEKMESDIKIIGHHPDLYICARDHVSMEILTSNFHCKPLLLPDMAFCISRRTLNKYKKESTDHALLVKRTDHELQNTDYSKYINEEISVHDWPSLEQRDLRQRIFYKLMGWKRILGNKTAIMYADKIYRPYLIKTGIKFISRYKSIYTTRLHVAILSVLLDKPFTLFDNTYKKNTRFYETWLSDIDTIKVIQTSK